MQKFVLPYWKGPVLLRERTALQLKLVLHIPHPELVPLLDDSGWGNRRSWCGFYSQYFIFADQYLACELVPEVEACNKCYNLITSGNGMSPAHRAKVSELARARAAARRARS